MTTAVMSEAQLRTHYAAIKARLYGQPKRQKPYVAPVVPVQPVKITMGDTIIPKFLHVAKPVERPCIPHDAHVIAYQQWKLAIDRFTAAIHAGQMDRTLDELMRDGPKKEVKQIVEEVLEDYPGITWADLKSPRRGRRYVTPRHIAMYEVHLQRPDLSYPQLGRLFGGRDHTSCLFAVRKIAAQRAASSPIQEAAE